MLFPFLPLRPRVPRRLDLPDAEEFCSEELEEMIETGGLATQVAAARELASRKDPRAFPVLVEGLGNRHFRYASLEGLRILGDPRALEHAVSVLDRAFAGVFERTQAAGILAVLGDPRGSEHILERLARRKRDDDRGLAIEIAAELSLFEAVPALEKTAGDQSDIFRGAALKALAAVKPTEYEPLLTSIALDESEDTDVRADAMEALALMQREQGRRALLRLASSENEEVRALALRLQNDPGQDSEA